jgi:hypothetical protein
LARKSSTVSSTFDRLVGVGPDLDQEQLALHRLPRLELDDLEHVDQLVELLGDLLERVLLALTTIVIREISSCSVGPTASESMLKPRRENSPAILTRTPGLFSTSTDSVRAWSLVFRLPSRAPCRGRT